MKAERFPALQALILLSCLLTSCAAPSDNKQTTVMENDDGVFVESATIEGEPTREAVYVYGKSSPSDPREITLTLNAEPLLLGTTYLRLVGIVFGQNSVRRSSQSEGGPIAVVELSGKGLCLGLGEEVSGYKIVSILERIIKLKKR